MVSLSSAALLSWGAALVLCLATLVGCRGAAAPGSVEVRLITPPGNAKAVIEVGDLPDEVLRHLSASERSREEWANVLRVSVADGEPAMLGAYEVTGRTLRFTPMFPFDAGRQYHVAFNPGALTGAAPGASRLVTTVGLPAATVEPSTLVATVFPSADVVPENQLRLYIHFSAPMGRKGGLEYIKLVDDSGREVVDPFLPLDAEFWNDDRTRYTVFFDPGRQKRGILPNQQMGRSLERGRRYALVVSREWRDANGLPLKEVFKREFTVGSADERPLDVSAWRIAVPPAGSRDAIVVTFPEPLDHGLLLRALGVASQDGKFLEGDVKIEAAESRWSLTPRASWREGTYQLVAFAMLEDLAGNRIGRAFEVDRFDRADQSPEVERTSIPFQIGSTSSGSARP